MTFKNQNFTGTELKGSDFSDSSFQSCRFTGPVSFTGFQNCKFLGCDFSASTLTTVTFSGCSFPESKLSFLDFSLVHFDDCDFSEAVMNECVFQQLKEGSKQERKKFNLTSCQFGHTELKRSAFVWCDLKKVSFQGSDLEGAVFERCNLAEANLGECNLTGTGFEGSTISKTILDINGFISYGASKGFVLPE